MTTPLLTEEDTNLAWKSEDARRSELLGKRVSQDNVAPAAKSLSYQPYYDRTSIIRQDSLNANANSVAIDAQQKQREAALANQKFMAEQQAAIAAAQADANSWYTGMQNQYAQGGMNGGGSAGWGSGGAQGVANVLREAGFPEELVPTFMAIARAESGWNPTAINTSNRNGSTDRGLFQINSVHQGNPWYPTNPNDPLQSAKAALQIYRQQGLNAWTVYKTGAYQKFMQAAPPRQTYAVNTGSNNGIQFAQTNLGGPLRQQIVNRTMMELGTPYVWGGTNLVTGVDCSGLVQSVYGQLGIRLPRTAQEQYEYGTRTMGRQVGLNQLVPGDLVAWKGGYDRGRYIGHIAVYAGGGQIIEAPTQGVPVRRRSLYNTENAFGIHLNLPGD